ncbi:MAG: JmjC domain-containing protein [Burkholderiales bacterium]
MFTANDLSWDDFLRRHWQRAPWFAPGALPSAAGSVGRRELFALARRGDVESRLVQRQGPRWSVAHGPFTARQLARLPARNWTLLVNGVELHLPAMRALAERFRAIPYARHDDVMASFAAPGGGVGPHFDSYDVFLVQAFGRRRWRVSRQRDLTLVPDAPLRILRRMGAGRTWTVEPGDVLYLPPRVAHEGVALDACITLSVGFRAPTAAEMATRFLDFLHERYTGGARYADAGLRRGPQAGRLPPRLIDYAARELARLRWGRAEVAAFLGEYLSEPKPHTAFLPPARPLPRAAFARAIALRGVVLDLKSRLLTASDRAFMNGEAVRPPAAARALVARLADTRALAPQRLGASAVTLLYGWYREGYLSVGIGDSGLGIRKP